MIMYLISFCYGEYDSHIKNPVVVCKTYDEAEFFIHDVIENWNVYKNTEYVAQLTGFTWEFEHGQIFDYNFDIDPINLYEV